MRTATNQTGYNVERHDGPGGWQAINDEPFADKTLADQHLQQLAATPGAEYRVYPALSK